MARHVTHITLTCGRKEARGTEKSAIGGPARRGSTRAVCAVRDCRSIRSGLGDSGPEKEGAISRRLQLWSLSLRVFSQKHHLRGANPSKRGFWEAVKVAGADFV